MRILLLLLLGFMVCSLQPAYAWMEEDDYLRIIELNEPISLFLQENRDGSCQIDDMVTLSYYLKGTPYYDPYLDKDNEDGDGVYEMVDPGFYGPYKMEFDLDPDIMFDAILRQYNRIYSKGDFVQFQWDAR